MGYTFSGKILDPSGTLRISGAEVRLYDKTSNDLISTTTSDSLGKWSIDSTTSIESPWKYFIIAYDSGLEAGIVDTEKSFYTQRFSIAGDIIDSNTDLVKIPIVNSSSNSLYKVRIQSMENATGSGSIEVRNQANGAGSAITLSISDGNSEVSSTGDISSTDYFYFRSVTPCGFSNIFIELSLEEPLLVFPL